MPPEPLQLSGTNLVLELRSGHVLARLLKALTRRALPFTIDQSQAPFAVLTRLEQLLNFTKREGVAHTCSPSGALPELVMLISREGLAYHRTILFDSAYDFAVLDICALEVSDLLLLATILLLVLLSRFCEISLSLIEFILQCLLLTR